MKQLKAAKLSPNGAILIAAVMTLIAVPLRTFQYLNCLDPDTGFWAVRDVTVPVLYGLCIAVAILALVMSLFSGIMPKPEFTKQKDIPLGVAGILMTLGFLVDAFQNAAATFSSFGGITDTEELSMTYQLISTGTIARGFQVVFGILSAVFLLLFGLSKLRGNDHFQNLKLLALSPVLWGVCRLLVHFVEPISYKNVSQLLLEICLVVFAMIFWFAFARICSGVNPDSSMWLFFFGGVTGAFFAYVCALAPFMLILTGRGSLIPESRPMQYADLAFAIFATCALFNAMPKTVGVNSRDEFVEEEAPEVPDSPKKMSRAEKARERARLRKELEQERAYQAAAKAAGMEDGVVVSPFEDTGAGVEEVDVEAPTPGKAESYWKPVAGENGEKFVVTDED